jgi:hypothetical protein
MESTTTEPVSQGRRNRSSNTPAAPATYGYHNTFHTHVQLPPCAPPSYALANDPKTLRHLEEKAQAEASYNTAPPPPYTCTVELKGILGVRPELSSPFHVAANREWYDAYVVLEGTQLSIHRVKMPGLLSKSRRPTPGRFIKSYSLQHAEVGIASDYKKSALIPKSPFAHLVPASARPKLYETDPHMFEPVREHVIRLRLETEQFLLCAPSQLSVLSWIENLCAAIDISTPIEDRSEPRYRSLPRRSRRQRILDSALLGDPTSSLSSLEAGQRIIAEQEQIIRQLYPQFGAAREPTTSAAELELDDFDPEDVRFPSRSIARGEMLRTRDRDDEEEEHMSSSSPNTKHRETIHISVAQESRYRRRCAPVLLASSPRVSDIVFSAGQRLRINIRDHTLVAFSYHAPRYDAHSFPKARAKKSAKLALVKTAPVDVRPASPVRGVSDESISSISFGEDLAPSASRSTEDVSSSSGPPSPTGMGRGKKEVPRPLGKRMAQEGRESMGVSLGVGLVV